MDNSSVATHALGLFQVVGDEKFTEEIYDEGSKSKKVISGISLSTPW